MSTPRWTIPSDTRIDWFQWGEDAIFFHEPSGTTHRVDQVGATAVRLLEDRALTKTDLAEALAAGLEVDNDGDVATYAEAIIHQLNNLGIVKKGSP